MKLFTLRLALFAVLLVVAAAWTKEDYEIFRLNDEVTTTEGHNITFYGIFSRFMPIGLAKAFQTF